MNIEEIKMDHFENFEELIKTCKMWMRDDDIDAYYRFFEFNCMKALLTAYEKEKEERERIGKLYYEANEICIKYEKLIKKIEEILEKYKYTEIGNSGKIIEFYNELKGGIKQCQMKKKKLWKY